MKYKFKNNYIILYDNLKNIKIILNYNNSSSDMVANTIMSINNFCKDKYKTNYIVNFNKYVIDSKIQTKFKINKPKINVININTQSYINKIKNKLIIDITEFDRMIIIFSSNNFYDIKKYIEETKIFDELILKLIS